MNDLDEREAELAAIEAESIGWLPLGEGAYLHVGDPEAPVITVVGVPEVASLPRLKPLTEGRWEPSGYRDFMIRVDPMRPETREQRHVHFARE